MSFKDHDREAGTISRATSVSRASKHGSTVSRAQSLIKKNVAPQDLKPSDVLIERFVAWKAIVKQLISYFEVRSLLFLQFVPGQLSVCIRVLLIFTITLGGKWLNSAPSSKYRSEQGTNFLVKGASR